MGHEKLTFARHIILCIESMVVRSMKTMNTPVSFGKYKGQLLSHMVSDDGYMKWLSEQDWWKRRPEYRVVNSGSTPVHGAQVARSALPTPATKHVPAPPPPSTLKRALLQDIVERLVDIVPLQEDDLKATSVTSSGLVISTTDPAEIADIQEFVRKRRRVSALLERLEKGSTKPAVAPVDEETADSPEIDDLAGLFDD